MLNNITKVIPVLLFITDRTNFFQLSAAPLNSPQSTIFITIIQTHFNNHILFVSPMMGTPYIIHLSNFFNTSIDFLNL